MHRVKVPVHNKMEYPVNDYGLAVTEFSNYGDEWMKTGAGSWTLRVSRKC